MSRSPFSRSHSKCFLRVTVATAMTLLTPCVVLAQEAAAEAPQKISWLSWGYGALGPMYSAIFLLLSFTLVALFVMNLLTARRENVCPTDLVEGFENHLNWPRVTILFSVASYRPDWRNSRLATNSRSRQCKKSAKKKI